MVELQLGQKVRYKRTLTRKKDYKAVGSAYSHRAFWQPTEEEYLSIANDFLKRGPDSGFQQEWPEYFGEGIVTGIRTLQNGIHRYDSDYGWEFNREEHIKAYVVTHHIRRKPVFVLPEDIEVIAEPSFD